MATHTYLSHEERTAAEPRDDGIHVVKLGDIKPVNDMVKLFRLEIVDKKRGVRFLPGQWLDTYVPGVHKAGGFTITSVPADAKSTSSDEQQPFLELAVQKSPKNPPAAWLWRPQEEILGQQIMVRVGGSFVWPPPGIDVKSIKRVVLVAGGVGINPLISITSHLHSTGEMPETVRFLYSTKLPYADAKPSNVLFLDRLQGIASRRQEPQFKLSLHLTGDTWPEDLSKFPKDTSQGRISSDDLLEAVGTVEERKNTLCYICGPAAMTDAFVEFLQAAEGMNPKHVLCEKWW